MALAARLWAMEKSSSGLPKGGSNMGLIQLVSMPTFPSSIGTFVCLFVLHWDICLPFHSPLGHLSTFPFSTGTFVYLSILH